MQRATSSAIAVLPIPPLAANVATVDSYSNPSTIALGLGSRCKAARSRTANEFPGRILSASAAAASLVSIAFARASTASGAALSGVTARAAFSLAIRGARRTSISSNVSVLMPRPS